MKTVRGKDKPNKSKAVSNQFTEKNTRNFQSFENGPSAEIQSNLQSAANSSTHQTQTIQAKANNTGLPDQLKSGLEEVSGYSMDDVKVHYNSPEPSKLNAHAYAQGAEIHISPGQDKHLAHEAWHVVQQKQGRVRPTMAYGGVRINDDQKLEREADVMGNKISQLKGQPTPIGQGEAVQRMSSKNSVAQMIWTFDTNELTDPKKIGYILGGLAKNLGLDLNFLEFEQAIQAEIAKKGVTHNINDAKNDPSGHHLIRFYNLVSQKDLTVETAPKLQQVEKKKAPAKATAAKATYESIPDMVQQGLLTHLEAKKFQYYWGGTSKIDELLRKISDDQVDKIVHKETGLRMLTQGENTFFEAPSPFPSAEHVVLDTDDQHAIADIVQSFKLTSPKALKLTRDFYTMNKAKKYDARPNIKTIRAIFIKLETDLEPYKMSLDKGLEVWEREGIYTILSQVDPADAVVTLIDSAKMPGIVSYDHDPRLEGIAKYLAAHTDLLRSAEWKAARTDAEFDGMIGERIAQIEVLKGGLMPQAVKGEAEDKELKLHSVHFMGDLIKEAQAYRVDTDVTSELDLMSLIEHKDGTFSYYALGNIKVTKTSAAAEARKQNDMAELVTNAHIDKKQVVIAPGVSAVVKRVYGKEIDSNKHVELTDKLKKASGVAKLTIGAKGAKGEYDKNMGLSGSQIATIGLILREIEKKS